MTVMIESYHIPPAARSDGGTILALQLTHSFEETKRRPRSGHGK